MGSESGGVQNEVLACGGGRRAPRIRPPPLCVRRLRHIMKTTCTSAGGFQSRSALCSTASAHDVEMAKRLCRDKASAQDKGPRVLVAARARRGARGVSVTGSCMGRTPTTLTDPRTSMSFCRSGEPATVANGAGAHTSGASRDTTKCRLRHGAKLSTNPHRLD